MRTKVLHIIIFLMAYSVSYAFVRYDEHIGLFSNQMGLRDSIVYTEIIPENFINANQLNLFFQSVPININEINTQYYYASFQDIVITADEDDWWTTPPTTGSGTGTFVGGAPIGDSIELLFLLSLLYILFKIKNKKI